MTIIKHELRQNRTSFLVWTIGVALMLATCVFLFPEMKGEMEEVGDMFASMGSFTAAFGMDKLNFGTLMGYYGIECGNVLGLGGAMFASICGAATLAKEEANGTAEFLLAHPISRKRILAEKLTAVFLLITALNIVVYLVSVGSIAAIGEDIPWKELNLLHLAYYLMQIELGAVCYGFSAFMRKGSIGVGLGVALMMYLLNLLANIAEAAEFLKYITPFGYTESADIISEGQLEVALIALGMVYGMAAIAAAYWKYGKKDIQ